MPEVLVTTLFVGAWADEPLLLPSVKQPVDRARKKHKTRVKTEKFLLR
jgi:hypothetical protein